METWPAGGAPIEGDPRLPPRWRVGRRLGVGGQAAVWLAEDVELRQWVAVKVFRPDLSAVARERLRREVRLGRQLRHPGLVRIHELIEAGDRLAVVMEWMAGGSLARRLEAGPLPVSEVARVADEALAVLEYLHAHNVVHRDLKPSNLLLDDDGCVRIGDLGLARSLGDGLDLTRTSTTVGTPAFMSPEQLRGLDPLPASDLYGLGATLYQLLTGSLPFEASSEFEVARLHLTAPVPDPRKLRRDCPAWLARFVRRLMEKRAEDRWPDASAARRAFEARRGLTSPRARRAALRAAGVVAAALAVAFVGEGVIYPLLRRGDAVKVEAAGKQVRGVDRRGRTTWSIGLQSPVQHLERVDLDGDLRSETIIAAYPRLLGRGPESGAASEVLIVRSDGTVLTHVHPEDLITAGWAFPYPKLLTPVPRVLPLGGGRVVAMFLCPQRGFYPFALLAYWPLQDRWQCVLEHSGWMSDIVVVPGSSPPRVRVAGVNNRLGYLPVVGEIALAPPSSPQALGADAPIASPDLGRITGSSLSFAWYTVLAQGSHPSRIAPESDGGCAVYLYPGVQPERVEHVDRWGNPVPGPNAGRDLALERGRFLDRLAALTTYSQPLDLATLESHVEATRAGASNVLAEPPYRDLLDEAYARALARLGRLPDGIQVLQRTIAGSRFEEARFRLVQLLALANRLREAVPLAAAVVDHPWGDRAVYDGVHLLIRLAIEQHDPELLRSALLKIGKFEGLPSTEMASVNAALWARAHLWWDEVDEADCTVRSWQYAPEGDALACLARWRRGRTAPGEVGAMERAIAENPDAAWEGQVALAAAQLGNGNAAEAAGTLEQLIGTLDPLSRDDFMNFQVLCLGRALHAKALLAAGDAAHARSEAQALRPALLPGLLPRILVDEVLAADVGRAR